MEEAWKQKEEQESICLQRESQRAVPPKKGPRRLLLYHPHWPPACQPSHPCPASRLMGPTPLHLPKEGDGVQGKEGPGNRTDQRESKRGDWTESSSHRRKPSGPACPLNQTASRAGLSVCPPGVSLCGFLSRALPHPACPSGRRAWSETQEGSFWPDTSQASLHFFLLCKKVPPPPGHLCHPRPPC